MAVILLFSLGNASDAFLLLRLSDLGVAAVLDSAALVGAARRQVHSSLVGGSLSDRFGRRRMIALGWIIYALVYAAFGFTDSLPVVIAIFLAYGLVLRADRRRRKGVGRRHGAAGARGTAFGIYNAALGVGGLAASLMFGSSGRACRRRAASFTGAGLAVLAALHADALPAQQ